jgi:threonine dehydratase
MKIDIGIDDILAAAARLSPWAYRTPVLTSRALDERCGGQIFLKCENFQRVGAFKFRGAMNAVLQLSAESKKVGVVTHSSGNHAQALALAGKLAGVPVCVVMPRNAPGVKKAATEGYGARIVSCEPTLVDREATVNRLITEHGYELVHPYDELLDQAGPLDAVVTPCGGGGLLSGTAIAVKNSSPSTQVYGAEPENASDACRSLKSGQIEPSNDPKTIADGLRTSLGLRDFQVIRTYVDAIATATESEILAAMRLIWERVKIVIEPSCAVPVAAILNGQIEATGKRIGVILSGGNIDLEPMFAALTAKIA